MTGYNNSRIGVESLECLPPLAGSPVQALMSRRRQVSEGGSEASESSMSPEGSRVASPEPCVPLLPRAPAQRKKSIFQHRGRSFQAAQIEAQMASELAERASSNAGEGSEADTDTLRCSEASSKVDADSEADATDDVMMYESLNIRLNGYTILTSESLNGLMLCDPCLSL